MVVTPFERFLELKPCIEADRAIMERIALYAFSPRSEIVENGLLRFLGAGSRHIYFSIGEIDGIWLATRERFADIDSEYSSAFSKNACESYIEQLVRACGSRRVPAVCGGVAALIGPQYTRHFLLIEDLSCGGKTEFAHAPRTGSRRIDNEVGSGIADSGVFYKFPIHECRYELPEYRHMRDQHMICLRATPAQAGRYSFLRNA
jgi:hypothetical protein